MLLTMEAWPPPLRTSFPPRRRDLGSMQNVSFADHLCGQGQHCIPHVAVAFSGSVSIRNRGICSHVTRW